MSSRKKYGFLAVLTAAMLLLSGCTQLDQYITADSTGIWNKFFVYPMSQLITFFADLINTNASYGLAIIIVTIIIRSVLLPLNVKQLKSSRAMQDVQPELKKIQEKYSSKDANTQKKLQEETMALFQKHGVNPLAGCLPIFVQMPILIAMYHAIMRTEAIEAQTFLWFALDSPDYILPLIAGAATFFQQKLMMGTNSAASQNPQMKVMLYMMPVMITIFGFILPAALTLYWVVGNVFMVGQILVINKPMMSASNGGDSK